MACGSTQGYILSGTIALFILSYTMSVHSITVKYVPKGHHFNLTCPPDGSDAPPQNIRWHKDDVILEEYNDWPELYRDNVTFDDGGVYNCQMNNDSMNEGTQIIVGSPPSEPLIAVRCLESYNATVSCVFSAGDQKNDDFELCWKIEWFYAPHISGCERNASSTTVSFELEEIDFLAITNVTNSFGWKSREEFIEPIVKPDPPTITQLVCEDANKFNVTFLIPETWSEDSCMYYTGEYNQSGTMHDLGGNKASCDKSTVSFSFRVKDMAYSPVCLQLKMRLYLFTFGEPESLKWSELSEPVCNYTAMEAPSKGPEYLLIRMEDQPSSQDSSWLRDAHLTWKPPPREYWNGIIDHHEIVVTNNGQDVPEQRYEVPGNSTQLVIRDLHSNESYAVKLFSWTLGGPSEPIVKVIDALVPPQQYLATKHMAGPISTAVVIPLSVLIVAVVLACLWKCRQSTGRLPEPIFISQKKLNFYMTGKGPPPIEKEVFDVLIIPANIGFGNKDPVKDESKLLSHEIKCGSQDETSATIFSDSGVVMSKAGSDDSITSLGVDGDGGQTSVASSSYIEDRMENSGLPIESGDSHGISILVPNHPGTRSSAYSYESDVSEYVAPSPVGNPPEVYYPDTYVINTREGVAVDALDEVTEVREVNYADVRLPERSGDDPTSDPHCADPKEITDKTESQSDKDPTESSVDGYVIFAVTDESGPSCSNTYVDMQANNNGSKE